MNKERILTGDRPTGPLHLGHYVGSLEKRVELQDRGYECFFIVADWHVLTDHLRRTQEVEEWILDITLDWLSVGMDPKKSTFFIQSRIPQIPELSLYFSMLVTKERLERNPTVKEEARAARISEISWGFLGYPILQAADILVVKANLVPVGEDQLPHLEQCREIARKFNRLFGGETFPIPKALLGRFPRLPGLDGRKMSKSLNNAIFLSDSAEGVERKMQRAVTDPQKIHLKDKGRPEICNVFAYHRAFNSHWQEVENSCRQGEIGCVACKKRAATIINEFLEPIREKRAYFEKRPQEVREYLIEGSERVKKIAEETLGEVKRKLHFEYESIFG